MRSLWADMANQALERQGYSERISEKSHAWRLEEAREVLAQAPERSEAREAALAEVVAREALAEHLDAASGADGGGDRAAREAAERRRRRARAVSLSPGSASNGARRGGFGRRWSIIWARRGSFRGK